MTINPELPKRGEIWLVNFDPTVGAEIKKVRGSKSKLKNKSTT
ncbi:MAG: type II toxin-antitoxin system PemK/MazF family toxin [Microcystis aeruginosa G13-10]|nr:type II toxin-antitoxin system PemK/MazF family toxin [Microcystis aeruginosa G13-10]